MKIEKVRVGGGGHIIGGGLGLLIERTFVSRIVQKKKKRFPFSFNKNKQNKIRKKLHHFQTVFG